MERVVNGISMYYEVSGEGKPMILVHGNNESHHIFSHIVPELSKDYKVYTPDSRCHGDSTVVPGPLHYSTLADDYIAFIKQLNLDKPVFYGFSDGGIIGLLIAIKEPDLLGKLIVSGANINPEGLIMDEEEIEAIRRSNDDVAKMMLNEPNITVEELSSIKVLTVILVGEHDCIKQSQTDLIHESIKGSILEVLPGETHESYVVRSDKLYPIITKYL